MADQTKVQHYEPETCRAYLEGALNRKDINWELKTAIRAALADINRVKAMERALHHAINRTHDFSQGCSGCSDGVRLLTAKAGGE